MGTRTEQVLWDRLTLVEDALRSALAHARVESWLGSITRADGRIIDS